METETSSCDLPVDVGTVQTLFRKTWPFVGQHFNHESSVYELVRLLIVREIHSAGMRKKEKGRRIREGEKRRRERDEKEEEMEGEEK